LQGKQANASKNYETNLVSSPDMTWERKNHELEISKERENMKWKENDVIKEERERIHNLKEQDTKRQKPHAVQIKRSSCCAHS